eukprot:gene20760-31984_t
MDDDSSPAQVEASESAERAVGLRREGERRGKLLAKAAAERRETQRAALATACAAEEAAEEAARTAAELEEERGRAACRAAASEAHGVCLLREGLQRAQPPAGDDASSAVTSNRMLDEEMEFSVHPNDSASQVQASHSPAAAYPSPGHNAAPPVARTITSPGGAKGSETGSPSTVATNDEHASLKCEAEERRRQLEVIVSQLSQALGEQDALRTRLSDETAKRHAAERRCAAEQQARKEAEARALAAETAQLLRPPQAADPGNQQDKDRQDNPSSSPQQPEDVDRVELLRLRCAAKVESVARIREALDRAEAERVALERQRAQAAPLADEAFSATVAADVAALCAAPPRGGAAEMSVRRFVDAIAGFNDRSGAELPPAVIAGLNNFLADVRKASAEAKSAEALPCLRRDHGVAAVESLLAVLGGVTESGSRAREFAGLVPQMVAGLESVVSLQKAGDATLDGQARVLAKLRAARGTGAHRLAKTERCLESNEALARRLLALNAEQSETRSHLKQHRAERDEILAGVKKLEGLHNAFASGVLQAVRNEEENVREYRQNVTDHRAKVAVRQKDLERDKQRLIDLELRLLASQRELARGQKRMELVKQAVDGRKREADLHRSALQLAAAVKVRQISFVGQAAPHLLSSLNEHTAATRKACDETAAGLRSIALSEWDLLKNAQMYHMLRLVDVKRSLDQEGRQLLSLKLDSSQDLSSSSSSWLDSLSPFSAAAQAARQQKRIDAHVAQGREVCKELNKLRESFSEVETFVKTKLKPSPEDIALFDASALTWPD